MIVADSNVLTELSREVRDPNLDGWSDAQLHGQVFTTSVTVAEIRYGVERLADGRRKWAMRSAVERLLASFVDNILPFDEADAEIYASLAARCERIGRRVATFDAQIAAICLRHGATLATRNTRHFEETGVHLVNPWEWRPE
ncbi:MAG: type II toxin-antitoxin system VapC family toxin [Candidatus Dormibacteraceae bacterium]